MPKEIDNTEKTDLSQDKIENNAGAAIDRCFGMLDYISNSAADIITDVIYNNPCQEAMQFLMNRPEELAIRSYKKAITDYEALVSGIRNKAVN